MRKYGLVLFALSLILLPSLAEAGGGPVPTPEPGTLSVLGLGLLTLASVSGVKTVRLFIEGRRSRSTSTNEP